MAWVWANLKHSLSVLFRQTLGLGSDKPQTKPQAKPQAKLQADLSQTLHQTLGKGLGQTSGKSWIRVLLNIGYVSNETNTDVCMYIEEFYSSRDLDTLLLKVEVIWNGYHNSLYTNATIDMRDSQMSLQEKVTIALAGICNSSEI